MKRALLYVAALFVLQFLTSFIVSFAYNIFAKEPANPMPIGWDVASMVFYSVATLAVFLGLRWATVSRRYVRSRPWTVVAWTVVAAVGAIVPSMALQELLPEWPEWARQIADATNSELVRLMRSPAGYIVVALLPPVVEELVFRGAVLRSLLQWKPERRWLMITVSALLFALIHMNPDQMVHAFLIGLLLGWMYERTGSIFPGVVYHWVNNTLAYLMFHIYHNPETVSDMFGPTPMRTYMAVGFSLCMLLPAIYQLKRTMKRPADVDTAGGAD